MNKEEVSLLFGKNKHTYLEGLVSCENPTAFLLGGQGAVGKGQLLRRIDQCYTLPEGLLSVNGDLYRKEHPENEILQKDPETYSEKTQLFSSVFTEGFISEAIRNRYNICVEGTMRNPSTPMGTAALFHKNGFRVEAYVIAAPKEVSSLNLYTRYAREMQVFGTGRLADKASHDAAVEGMPESLDMLYRSKAVDAIRIYTCFAKEKIRDYCLTESGWNDSVLPSVVIGEARQKQLQDNTFLGDILERSLVIEYAVTDRNILGRAWEVRNKIAGLLPQDMLHRIALSGPEKETVRNSLDYLSGKKGSPWIRSSFEKLCKSLNMGKRDMEKVKNSVLARCSMLLNDLTALDRLARIYATLPDRDMPRKLKR